MNQASFKTIINPLALLLLLQNMFFFIKFGFSFGSKSQARNMQNWNSKGQHNALKVVLMQRGPNPNSNPSWAQQHRDSLAKLIIKNKTRDTNRFVDGLQPLRDSAKIYYISNKSKQSQVGRRRSRKRSEIYRLPYLPNCCCRCRLATINYDNLKTSASQQQGWRQEGSAGVWWPGRGAKGLWGWGQSRIILANLASDRRSETGPR